MTANALTALSPAKVWIGLKNSDDVGLRVDLRAEVFVKVGATETLVGSGDLLNQPAGSSGFNNAALHTIPLTLTNGSANFPAGAALEVKVSVRRTCSGPGHNSGTVRLWYNGQKVDSGPTRDAGSRFDATIGGQTDDYFLRTGLGLSTSAGSPRTSVDQFVNSAVSCATPVAGPSRATAPGSRPSCPVRQVLGGGLDGPLRAAPRIGCAGARRPGRPWPMRSRAFSLRDLRVTCWPIRRPRPSE